MGPSTNVDGESRGAAARASWSRRFNGAVDERRRRAAIICVTAAGRAATLQWGRRRTSTESSDAPGLRDAALGASMGPSTNVDGETAAPTCSPYLPSRFNGAVDERRRRDRMSSGAPNVARRLQWGRRRTSTESPNDLTLNAIGPPASMGPSTNVDGETRGCGRISPPTSVLQWGRRRTSTESRRRRPARGCSPCFNGAVDERRRRGSVFVMSCAAS